ncbi:MAG: ferric reductase-like transmembrane domain-containing protein [Ilumatobacteraceae bacterium]
MTHIWWYVARSGGIVAWAMLAISMFWGLALSSRFLGKRPKPNWMLDLHRFVGGLATVFTIIHVVALMLDTYVSFGLVDVLVPFTGTYHPLAVAWGIIAMYFLIAVEITSLLRKKLDKRSWRLTHYLSFPLFALATFHLLWVGSDRATPLLRFGVLGAVAAVCIATMMRIIQADRADQATPARVPAR